MRHYCREGVCLKVIPDERDYCPNHELHYDQPAPNASTNKIISVQVNPSKVDELIALTDTGEIWVWDKSGWDLLPPLPETKA